jgi:hypothetical protein
MNKDYMKTAFYKGFECKVLYDYGNGYVEILFGDQILLICESKLTYKK